MKHKYLYGIGEVLDTTFSLIGRVGMSRVSIRLQFFLATICLVFLCGHAYGFIGGQKVEVLPKGYLRYGSSLFGHCSGTKIRPRVILTAAHCVDGRLRRINEFPSDYREHFTTSSIAGPRYRDYSGSDDALKAGDEMANSGSFDPKKYPALSQSEIAALSRKRILEYNKILAIYSHPNYTSAADVEFDVAVVLLEYDIPWVESADIDTTYNPQKGSRYFALGHDDKFKIKETLGKSNDYTKNYNGEYFDNYTYNKSLKGYSFASNRGKGGVTTGDSGGPLYRFNPRTNKYDTVIGIVSATKGRFTHNASVFTPIHKDSQAGRWLIDTLKKITP